MDTSKQFHIVAGMPIIKAQLLHTLDGTFEELVKEGKESNPLLEKVLHTALGRYKCKFEIGPPKSKPRFNIKSSTRGYKRPRENTDFCRAYMYVTIPEQIIKLSNFFRPSNNSNVLLFEDCFAVPKISTDLRRLQIKIRLPNGHIGEIQVRHLKMKKAFDDSHEAYEKEAAAERRYPDPTSRPLSVQKIINHNNKKRYLANHIGANKLPSLKKLIHKRDFYRVGGIPVMVVYEPFTNDRYTVVPKNTDQGPMYVRDNAFLSNIDHKDDDIMPSSRDEFITLSTVIASDFLDAPALQANA